MSDEIRVGDLIERRADAGGDAMTGIYVATAYHPRPRGWSNVNEHYVASEPLQAGRLRRRAGQALCSTRNFWQLEKSDRPASCPRCIAVLKRHGIAVRA
jgi:hypothetical protein